MKKLQKFHCIKHIPQKLDKCRKNNETPKNWDFTGRFNTLKGRLNTIGNNMSAIDSIIDLTKVREAQHHLSCTFMSPMDLPLLHPCDFQSCWALFAKEFAVHHSLSERRLINDGYRLENHKCKRDRVKMVSFFWTAWQDEKKTPCQISRLRVLLCFYFFLCYHAVSQKSWPKVLRWLIGIEPANNGTKLITMLLLHNPKANIV